MNRWLRAAVLAALGAAGSRAVEIQHWSGALCASIWDATYKKGLGGWAGAESHLPIQATVATAELGYAYYNALFAGTDDMHEVFGTLGLRREFHPFEDELLFPRLGIHAGLSRNYRTNLHALAGFNLDGVIPVNPSWSVLLSFQPSYSMGSNARFFWRAALGVLVDVKP